MPIVSPVVTSVVSSVVSGADPSPPAPPAPVCRQVATLNGTTQAIQLDREDTLSPNESYYIEGRWDLDTTGTLVSQNISGSTSSREFQIYTQNGIIHTVLGGVDNIMPDAVSGSPLLGVEHDAVARTLKAFVDGVLVSTKTGVTIGGARESTAKLLLGARHAGSNTQYGFRKPGICQDFKMWTGGNKTTGTLVRDIPVDDGFSANPTIRDRVAADGEAIGFTAGTWAEVCE